MKKNPIYWNDIEEVIISQHNWHALENKTILLTGASGTLGQIIVDVIYTLNKKQDLNCHIIAVSRNFEKAESIFKNYISDNWFQYYSVDINSLTELEKNKWGNIDYILHAASNTHPVQYAEDPIGTVATNVFGTFNLLQLAVEKKANFLLFSSVEIYGENNLNKDAFKERDMGYLDCATLRAGYPESKRVSEAMCYAFAKKREVDFKIVRLARVYGATMPKDDSKAIAQFINNGRNHENIVLKSDGSQVYSFVYSLDAVSGIFTVLLDGKKGEVYNISGNESIISLKKLAEMIAKEYGVTVVHQLPNKVEEEGFSKATKAVLDCGKLYELGWREHINILDGIQRIVAIDMLEK